PYAATKKAGELIAHSYAHIHGLPITCLRFFKVYGPRQRPEMAIHKLARLIIARKPVPLFADGPMRRDLTYFDDIIDCVIRSIAGRAGCRISSLGQSIIERRSEILAALEKAIGRKAKIERLPERSGDVKVTYADVSRARKDLGSAQGFPLEKGLERFAAWL